MKTQIVYALIASEKDLFLQECWASVYSLRLYEPDREVRVCCDEATAGYIEKYPDFIKLITEVVVVPIPKEFNSKQRSREIKTSIRKHIKGNYLFVDTDTVFAGTLGDIDIMDCSIAAVPEFHVHLKNSFFRDSVINNIKNIFDVDVSDAERWHNSGVMFVADNEVAQRFYETWNRNWRYSAFERGNSQDQPSLLKTDKELGYVIEELPGEYNCQMAMSVEHFFYAKIIHYLHFSLLPKQCNPFVDKSIYKKIKDDGGISEDTARTIKNCKSTFSTPSTIVDGDTVSFLLSNPCHVFMAVAREGGWLLSLMNKVAAFFAVMLKHKKVKVY